MTKFDAPPTAECRVAAEPGKERARHASASTTSLRMPGSSQAQQSIDIADGNEGLIPLARWQYVRC